MIYSILFTVVIDIFHTVAPNAQIMIKIIWSRSYLIRRLLNPWKIGLHQISSWSDHLDDIKTMIGRAFISCLLLIVISIWIYLGVKWCNENLGELGDPAQNLIQITLNHSWCSKLELNLHIKKIKKFNLSM